MRLHVIALGLVSLLLAGATALADEAPRMIGSGKQLFVGPWSEDGRDEHLVASMKNVVMTMNEARITGERLIVRDEPWEGTRLLDMYMCVLKDGDKFRMYYGAMPKYPKVWQEPNCRILCYAESDDGIHWEKPNLGIVEWEGSRDNNIILPRDDFPYTASEYSGPWVFVDHKTANPDERYKLVIKMTPVRSGTFEGRMLPKGQYLFASPDGIHWKLTSDRKVNPGASDAKFSMFFDEKTKKYITYTRVKQQSSESRTVQRLKEFHREQYGLDVLVAGRLVGRVDSSDLVAWGKESAVFATDTLDHAGLAKGYADSDVEDGKGGAAFSGGVDIYEGNVTRYSEAPDVYIGLPAFFYHWKKIETAVAGKRIPDLKFPGTLDVQLVTSRDGIHFHRAPQRRPFMRLGPHKSWYSRMLWPAGNVIRVGDELWIYFSGNDVAHNREQDLLVSNGAYGRAILRLDGFISADAAYTGGELITKPLVFTGSRLQLNVDTSAGGSVRVEIQDAAGKPVDGFTAAESDEINGNYIRVLCGWNGDPDVAPLAGKPIKLRFLMRDTKLYSFRFLPQPIKGAD